MTTRGSIFICRYGVSFRPPLTELSRIVGGDASGNHNPAKCPGSHHPNCR
jgi:hypothetical protein